MRKKTPEEYVLELAAKNPMVEVVDDYINSSTPITHHCLLHDVYWKAAPNNVLSGRGCPQCKKEKYKAKRMKSHDEYVAELAIKNPTVVSIEQYNGKNTPIKHLCLIHNVEWDISPSNALKGKGCNQCMREKIGNKLRHTHEQYVDSLEQNTTYIEPSEEYRGRQTPIKHHCLKHDEYFVASPNNVLRGQGCLECMREQYRIAFAKTPEEYINDMAEVNPDIEVIGTYINANTPILHKCKICGYEWCVEPTNALNGRGCPQCKESNAERHVRFWLDEHGVIYEREKRFDDCRDKNHLPFDFYLPDYNTLIEVQGQQHYHPVDIFGGEKVFELQQRHDKIKADYCKANNIRLLCIPYYEDVEEQLNNFLFI